MKTLRVISRTVACIGISVSTAAFAANRGRVHIYSPVTVAGERLAAGDYIARWDGDGPGVDLEIVQRRKVRATTHAVVKNLKEASVNDTSVIATHADGTQSLWQIFFSGRGIFLELDQDR